MLPTSLETATERMMKPNSIAREVLGDDFVEHFGGTRKHEVQLWNEAVTNWEGDLPLSISMWLRRAHIFFFSRTLSGVSVIQV